MRSNKLTGAPPIVAVASYLHSAVDPIQDDDDADESQSQRHDTIIINTRRTAEITTSSWCSDKQKERVPAVRFVTGRNRSCGTRRNWRYPSDGLISNFLFCLLHTAVQQSQLLPYILTALRVEKEKSICIRLSAVGSRIRKSESRPKMLLHVSAHPARCIPNHLADGNEKQKRKRKRNREWASRECETRPCFVVCFLLDAESSLLSAVFLCCLFIQKRLLLSHNYSFSLSQLLRVKNKLTLSFPPGGRAGVSARDKKTKANKRMKWRRRQNEKGEIIF